MKKFALLITVLVCAYALPGQAQMMYQKGDLLVNTGVGLGSSVYGTVSLNGSVEYFVNEDLSVGGAIGYSGYRRNYVFNDPLRINVFYFGPRGSYHFADALDIENEALDLYVGAFVGFGITTVSYRGERFSGYSDVNDFGYDIFGGVRYQFNPKVAAYGELGFGVSILQMGVSFKL